jgi:aminopeptidase-like protein
MLKPIVEQLYPLHRTLASDGTDEALRIVGAHMPAASNYTIETYAPGAPVWTWRVPERYVVHAAYLETEDGRRVIDFADNPLSIVSYSLPIDRLLTWDELEPHLHFNEKRPHTIPWVFKFYERGWGFCLPKNLFDQLDRTVKYRAVIRAEFVNEPGFRVGVGVIDPEGGARPEAGEMIIAAHVCHPMQANDDAAGVASALGVARRLAEHPLPAGSMSVRFLFCAETIGSIAYLAHNEHLIPNLKGGIFLEMTGNQNPLAWHHSRQHGHLLDRITNYQLQKSGLPIIERPFASAPANDERVINGPGVNVPCISLNRAPYDEYHTTDDSPSIIHEDMLQGAAEAAEAIIRIFASNYVPVRTFKGPVFLSGHGLWVDWRENWALNRAIEKIMMRFEGDRTVFDIAEEVGLDYWEVRAYVERFREKGLVEAVAVPSEN